MGLFGKGYKAGKVYNMSDALKIVKQDRLIELKEVAGGYMIVNEAEERAKANQEVSPKVSQKERKQEFSNRINGNGAYQEINFKPCGYEKVNNRGKRWKAEEFTR